MLLTIGMIVKNEEKYLEQCLTGLKHILDNVDSELIIADTGSTDNTVEIARHFTNNVFHFEWIDNFAAARNSTIERAKGEWYMFVDGDEVFENCDNIISFFNSGEYKKYNAASFIIRNILSSHGDTTNTHYNDFNAPRLCRIQPHTQFVGKIHETLNTYIAPFKKLNDIALHYGYLYENDEELKAKMLRNIGLLEKKLEGTGESASPQLYLQLYESYSNYDSDKAHEYLEKGIKLAKEKDDIVLIALYCDKAQDALARGNYENAIEVCNEYFAANKAVRPHALTSDAEIYAIQASSNYNLENYEKAIESYIKFFDTYKLIKSDKLITYDSYLIAYSIASDRNFIPLLNEFVYCCTHIGKYNLASSYLQTLPINRYSEVMGHISVIVKQIISVMSHLDYQGAKQYYKRLDDHGRKIFKNYLCLEVFLSDTPETVISAVAEIAKDDNELSEKIYAMRKFFSGERVPENVLVSFSEKYCISQNPEILFIALQQNDDITQLFNSPEFDMKMTVYMGYMTVYGFALAVQNYRSDSIRNFDDIPPAIKFLEYCMKTLPIFRSPKPGIFIRYSVEKVFAVYAELGERYAANIREEELPPEIKAAQLAGDIISARHDKRYKECFSLMKKAVQVYSGIAVVIEEYQKIVLKEYEDSIKNMSEMDKLAEAVKKNIRSFIAAGNKSAAKKTLDEYSQINPSDPEIQGLYQQVE